MSNLLFNLFKADYIKAKRTGFYLSIFSMPLLITLLFLLWCFFMPYNSFNILHSYLIVLTIASPIMISVTTCLFFHIEKKCGNYKELLSTKYTRKLLLISKLVFYIFFYLISIFIPITLFYLFFNLLGNPYLFTTSNYLFLLFIIASGQLIIILFHTWIGIKYEKGIGIGIGIGIVATFINAMMMTELGNGIWKYFPTTWSVIPSHIFLLCHKGEYLTLPICIADIRNMIFYSTGFTLIGFVLLLFWFSKYEDTK